MSPGDVVFTPTGRDHGISSAPVALDRLAAPLLQQPEPVSVDAEFVCGGWQHVREQPHPYLRSMPTATPDYERHPSLRGLVGLVSEDMQGSRPDAGLMIPALLDLLLIHTLGWWKSQHDEPGVADAEIAAVLQAVNMDPGAPWTVGRLSSVVGLHPASFTRRFTAAMGEPPMQYVIGRRLARGAWLLRSTRESLAAIARQTGYSSEFAFSAAFRKRFGVAPSLYRKQHE